MRSTESGGPAPASHHKLLASRGWKVGRFLVVVGESGRGRGVMRATAHKGGRVRKVWRCTATAALCLCLAVACSLIGGLGPDADLERSIDAFHQASFDGDVEGVWSRVSQRCADKLRAAGAEDEVADSVQFLQDEGASVGPRDVEIEAVDETTRFVTYLVYRDPGVQQEQIWVLEDGAWKLDTCGSDEPAAERAPRIDRD